MQTLIIIFMSLFVIFAIVTIVGIFLMALTDSEAFNEWRKERGKKSK